MAHYHNTVCLPNYKSICDSINYTYKFFYGDLNASDIQEINMLKRCITARIDKIVSSYTVVDMTYMHHIHAVGELLRYIVKLEGTQSADELIKQVDKAEKDDQIKLKIKTDIKDELNKVRQVEIVDNIICDIAFFAEMLEYLHKQRKSLYNNFAVDTTVLEYANKTEENIKRANYTQVSNLRREITFLEELCNQIDHFKNKIKDIKDFKNIVDDDILYAKIRKSIPYNKQQIAIHNNILTELSRDPNITQDLIEYTTREIEEVIKRPRTD